MPFLNTAIRFYCLSYTPSFAEYNQIDRFELQSCKRLYVTIGQEVPAALRNCIIVQNSVVTVKGVNFRTSKKDIEEIIDIVVREDEKLMKS